MAVHTETKAYNTKAHFGMIDVTSDFQEAVSNACTTYNISSGIITGFTTGDTFALTTREFEPGIVNHDLYEAFDRLAPH